MKNKKNESYSIIFSVSFCIHNPSHNDDINHRRFDLIIWLPPDVIWQLIK